LEIDQKTLYDAWGHVGYIFIALGMFLLSKKSIWGWVSRFVGEFIWLVVGWYMGMSSIWGWGLLFLCMEIYGFRSWWKDSRKTLEEPEKSLHPM
jgi:hypothetical protein